MARRFLGRNALLAIAGVALVGAAIGAAWQSVDNRRAASAHLQRDIRTVAADVVRRIAAFETGLRGTRGALIAATPRGITRDRFRNYARSRDFDREFPGSRGFGYIRRVPDGAEAAFTASARRDGARDFRNDAGGEHRPGQQMGAHEGPLRTGPPTTCTEWRGQSGRAVPGGACSVAVCYGPSRAACGYGPRVQPATRIDSTVPA